jgi:hypothetical protein
LRDGRFVFRLETGKFNGPSSLQFLQQLRSASRGTGRRVVVITHNTRYHHSRLHDRGGNNTPITLPWTSRPLTVPNSTPSSECGSSPAVVAYTIATSTISKTSSARLNPSSQPGPLATMSSADYAQLLKTLCLVSADSSLHVVTECLAMRAPAPGIVPSQISFEIGQIPEKPESIDDTLDHMVEVRPLVPAKKRGEIGNVVIACTRDSLAEPAMVEIRTVAVP